MNSRSEIIERSKELLVEGLRLEVEPAEIVDTEGIFGDGLGLDSIDALEFVVLIEEEFDVVIADEEEAKAAFASIAALADFILAAREQTAS